MFLAAIFAVTLPVCSVKEAPEYQSRTCPGRVVPVAQVDVMPQVSGEILEVCFENGAVVKAGDILYRLDPVKYKAAVRNAESKLAETKASLKYAEISYERHKSLMDTRAVSLDAVDNALSQRDAARAALAAAEADLVTARDDLEHCTITAPISGRIGSTLKTKGNYVTAGSQPLVTLVQTDPIRVRFSISNREYIDYLDNNAAANGRKLIGLGLTLANGKAYAEEGGIEYAENISEETTDSTQIYALFANADSRLVPGGTVSVTISTKKGVMRPAIPPTAVMQDTQGPYVWVLDAQNRAERRTIARGGLAGDLLFVEKGLAPGERIVADGAHKVKRGMAVEPAK